ncbi:hypothetical protein Dvina_05640 [Dactylosporangium vinaceum]|uniref:SCO2521 family protein n=1 Tax=Dactylosporangium vinaceum TaxID=53362 RepID=A0ABV5MIL4_9ACTN|nr:SCO2521 family protein [Dactylosporangium vinaceum]UAB97625.1 hypothetical protein Dvina_05640 [Dactylosporangium vinaceum]
MLIGEIHTGLVQHSTALSLPEMVQLLQLREGAHVATSVRPTSYAASAEIPDGVDCMLPSAAHRRVRAVGTMLSRASIIGGRVIQASAAASVETSAAGRRLAWPHYIARAGRLEVIGKWDPADMVDGFLRPRPGAAAEEERLEPGGIATRLIDRVQMAEALDRSPPLRAARTHLRWAVHIDEARADDGLLTFTVDADGQRSLEMVLGSQDAAEAEGLCRDLALHDWLLTTVNAALDAAHTAPPGAVPRAARLGPVVEHLSRLWTPGARVAPAMLTAWEQLERRPGFTRQWQSSIAAARDLLAVATFELLHTARPAGAQSLTKT